MCDETVDFDKLQHLQDEEMSHLVAVERQVDEVAGLTKPCPCWTEPGCAACKRLKAQLESEANLREALASSTETIELLQAAQQKEMSTLRLARENELSLMIRKVCCSMHKARCKRRKNVLGMQLCCITCLAFAAEPTGPAFAAYTEKQGWRSRKWLTKSTSWTRNSSLQNKLLQLSPCAYLLPEHAQSAHQVKSL